MRRGTELLLITALMLLALLARHSLEKSEEDVGLYRTTAQQLEQGELPYVSFHFEYPPLAALLFTAPRLLGSDWFRGFGFYRHAFMFEAALFAAAGLTAIRHVARRLDRPVAGSEAIYVVLVLALFPLMLQRYDVFPAVTTAFALMCLIDDRPAAAGGWLGMGIALKLYPFVLLPVFVGYELARRRWGALLRVLLATGIASAAPLLPYALLRSGAFLQFLRYHSQRGLQMESVSGAAILLAAGATRCTHVAIVYNFGAHHLVGRWPNAMLRVQPPLAAALMLVVTALSLVHLERAGQQSAAALGRAAVDGCAALVFAFIVANKVFSPQYLLWTIPFLPLLGRWKGWVAVVIGGGSSVLFLKFYLQLRYQHPGAILAWNLRNGAVIVLFAGVVARMGRAGATEPRPGRVHSEMRSSTAD